MSDLPETQTELSLEARIEALLFVASVPVSVNQLAEALECSTNEVEQGIHALDDLYARRGLALQRHEGRIQLTTHPMIGMLVERFLGLEANQRLSRAGLETLAIIAYRQPVTRPGVDSIRGVNSDGVMKSLLSKGLIQEVGRADGPGRPILYGTTSAFLQHFGLKSISQLPPFEVEEAIITDENRLLKD
ncbi:condensin subunit ScpB [Longilinea arvoryzae]|uniref:Segregation and condensation protein B n=1 Tax=Longilinea arvoryzae TaxID=360412 RepID=A0A0S7BHJ8_9CHLR|nr:SMC-Scp complex subunit ScpB [Longilinea arvoryzae]GAP14640.1 condensin subunit ScpB [Longilinea arvoryzae]